MRNAAQHQDSTQRLMVGLHCTVGSGTAQMWDPASFSSRGWPPNGESKAVSIGHSASSQGEYQQPGGI